MQHPAIDIWHNEGIPVHEVDLVEVVAEDPIGCFGGDVEFELNAQRGG